MTRAEMIEHIRQQDMEIFDLIARVIEVIKHNNLWKEPQGSYTFKDGETWYRFEPEEDHATYVNKLEEEEDGR